MAVFHRLTVPSYFGGLPAGFDYVNNATSGTPAPADGQKSAGPNVGTYFVAFGEDATSSDANRANLALSTNTDYLDNLMRSDLVLVARTVDTGPTGSPTATITITGVNNIWVGDSISYLLRNLFHVVNANDREFNVSGTTIVVSSISGASIGDGFATGNVTLTLNVSIPTGSTYHVYFGKRGNLATLPTDAFARTEVYNQQSVDGSVVDFVAQTSAPGVLGSNVTALEAYSFSTPDGTRLAKTSSFFLDCDPTDSGAPVRSYNFRTRHASVNRELAILYDDPTSTLYAGLTGLLQTDAGVGFSSLGTFIHQDANLNAGIASGMNPTWPLTSSVAGNGDAYPRLFEATVTAAALGGPIAPSVMRYSNGRWCCTVGDGTSSFGDFSGPGALIAAFAYAASVSVAQLHIQVKRGTYNINSTIVVTSNVILEGVSQTQTILQGNAASVGMFNMTNGRLVMRHMSLQYVSGVHFAVLGAAGTSLLLDEVETVDLGVQMVNSAVYKNIAALHCRKCRFAPVTAGVIAIDLQFSDNNANVHNGYYFDECAWFCSDETQTVRIIGDPTQSATVQRVVFSVCRYSLGGTGTTASHLTRNTGVLEINPNGGNGLLTVTDISWLDCYPLSTTGSVNAPLARVYGIGLGDNSTTHLAVIQSVTIRGGVWTANQTAGGATIAPFLISAQQMIIEDVAFIGCALTSGGPSSEDRYIVDGSTHSLADWAQFVFAPGGQATTLAAAEGDIRLSMRSVSFRGFTQLSNSGDVWFYLGAHTEITDVTFTDYGIGGGGSVPSSRLRISANKTIGAIKNVRLLGGSTSTGSWTTSGTTAGSGGIVVMMPTQYTTGYSLPVDGLCVIGWLNGSGGRDDGILLRNLTADTGGWQFSFIDCSVGNAGRGLVLYGHGTAGSGGNGLLLEYFSVVRGNYFGCQNAGVHLFPDAYGTILLDGVRGNGNGGAGISLFPNTWAGAGGNMVEVANCRLTENGTYEFDLQSQTPGELPRCIFKGNTCIHSGAMGKARFQTSNAMILASPAAPGVATFIYGVETSFSTVGGATQPMLYVAGDPMVENYAQLATPT